MFKRSLSTTQPGINSGYGDVSFLTIVYEVSENFITSREDFRIRMFFFAGDRFSTLLWNKFGFL